LQIGKEDAPTWYEETRTMHHLLMNLPVMGTLGVAALIIGPMARLTIDLGAWSLERFDRWVRAAASRLELLDHCSRLGNHLLEGTARGDHASSIDRHGMRNSPDGELAE